MRLALFALALAVLAAPLVWRVTAPRDTGPVVDPVALAERVAMLEVEVETLRDRLETLQSRPAPPGGQGAAPLPAPQAPSGAGDFSGFGDLMLLSARREINKGLTLLGIRELESVFGQPSAALGQTCAEPTSERLASALETRDVGPFRARLVSPALDSLEQVLARVAEDYPDLYAELRTYGGFCARLIRGSADQISRHAFGVAIDVSVGGTIDPMGDGKTQFGLIVLSDYFTEEGWIWGAGFGREDSMHFEVSAELFRRWRDEGLI
ncbi:MAG: M15 family metallopeptidase [Paracoccaceae bacterium]